MYLTFALPLLSFLALPIGWLEFRLLSRTRRGILLAPLVVLALYGSWFGAAYRSFLGIRLGFEMFAGLAMLAVAFGLWMAAPSILRADTRLNTWPEQLVTTGLYHWVRHPLYLGHVLFISAVLLMAGATSVFLETPLLWILAYVVARYEETTRLVPRFGEAFRTYKTQTPLLMPAWGWAVWGFIYAGVCYRLFS